MEQTNNQLTEYFNKNKADRKNFHRVIKHTLKNFYKTLGIKISIKEIEIKQGNIILTIKPLQDLPSFRGVDGNEYVLNTSKKEVKKKLERRENKGKCKVFKLNQSELNYFKEVINQDNFNLIPLDSLRIAQSGVLQ